MIQMQGNHHINGKLMNYRPDTIIDDPDMNDADPFEEMFDDSLRQRWIDGFWSGAMSVIGIITAGLLIAEAFQ